MALHKPKKGHTFTLGMGPSAETCDVTSVKDDVVNYTVRRDSSERFFCIGSPQHELALWWGDD